jgi:DNA-binding NtrC family response regulator
LERVAGYDEPVMLLGDAGTGKELFARRLHKIGRAPNGPLVAVNCGSFDAGPAEDDLFAPDGAIARAKGGTLFLNDILALPISQQGRLVTLLGSRAEQGPGFRLISATGEPPRAALAAGRLRADLYYRLSVLPIALPPLRDRRDDLPLLIEHFRRLHSRRHGKPIRQLSGAAMDLLLRYDYPGNVRELSNLIERGVIYAEPGGEVDISHLFTGMEEMPQFVDGLHATGRMVRRAAKDGPAAGLTLQEIEVEAIQRALDAAGGNVSATARALGLSRAKLDYRLSKLGIRPGR